MTNLERLNKVCMAYEDKLKELMTETEFKEFSTELAKELFAEELCDMADGEFKVMILEHFDDITGTDEDYQDLLDELQDDIATGDYDNGADY